METSQHKFYLITCIVQRGMGDSVWKAAKDAGAGGVTINFARGMGVREKLGILGVAISPEKEVLHMVVPEDQTDKIFDAVAKAAKLDRPGMGFAFVQPVRRVAGHFEFKGEEE